MRGGGEDVLAAKEWFCFCENGGDLLWILYLSMSAVQWVQCSLKSYECRAVSNECSAVSNECSAVSAVQS